MNGTKNKTVQVANPKNIRQILYNKMCLVEAKEMHNKQWYLHTIDSTNQITSCKHKPNSNTFLNIKTPSTHHEATFPQLTVTKI